MLNRVDILLTKESLIYGSKSGCEYKSGAILVKDNVELSRAFNEKLTEINSKSERDLAIHAEAAAISKCTSAGISTLGATIYSSRFPCLNCAFLLYKSGIKRVFYYYNHISTNNEALPFLTSVGVECINVTDADFASIAE